MVFLVLERRIIGDEVFDNGSVTVEDSHVEHIATTGIDSGHVDVLVREEGEKGFKVKERKSAKSEICAFVLELFDNVNTFFSFLVDVELWNGESKPFKGEFGEILEHAEVDWDGGDTVVEEVEGLERRDLGEFVRESVEEVLFEVEVLERKEF